MQRQQEEAIAELRLKLNEQSQVKVNLMQMNKFKPNLTFNRGSFGQLNLNEYVRIDPFKSKILSGQQPFGLINLCEFSLNDKWTLLYRGTRDGFRARNFHAKCDGHNNTLTILKAHGTSYIFGGFTTVTWASPCQFKADPNAFLFSLTNRDNQPSKMRKINATKSIICHPNLGPIFGDLFDILICDYSNTTAGCYSLLGNSYQHPQPNEGGSYLAGSFNFQLSEIEVYQKR